MNVDRDALTVLIPWAPSSPARERALELVRDHLAPFRVLLCPGSRERFNRGRALNQAVRYALSAERRGGVLVINDADSLCPHAQIERAAELALAEPGLVYAYTTYHRLSEKATGELANIRRLFDDDLYEQAMEGPFERELYYPPAQGCAAITGACYLELGGYDESYVGWGYEDIDFAERAGKLAPCRRVPGPLVHLWHGDRRGDDSPLEADPADVAANLARWEGKTVPA